MKWGSRGGWLEKKVALLSISRILTSPRVVLGGFWERRNTTWFMLWWSLFDCCVLKGSWGGRRDSTWPLMAVVWVRMVRFCEYLLKALLTRFVLRCAMWEQARVRGLSDWKNRVAFYWNVNQRMGGEEVVTTWSCFLHLLHLRCLYICVHAAGSPSLNPGKQSSLEREREVTGSWMVFKAVRVGDIPKGGPPCVSFT